MRAGLLQGASVLALAAAWGATPAFAQDMVITTSSSDVDIAAPVLGDVINQATIGNFTNPAPFTISSSVGGSFINNGAVQSNGVAVDILVGATMGGGVVNNGDILVDLNVPGGGGAFTVAGIRRNTTDNNVEFGLDNAGTLSVDVDVAGPGDVTTTGWGYFAGAPALNAASFEAENSGTLVVDVQGYSIVAGGSSATGVGITAGAVGGTFLNSGDILVTAATLGGGPGPAQAVGVVVAADRNGVVFTNTGTVEAHASTINASTAASAIVFASNTGGVYAGPEFPGNDGGTLDNEGGRIISTIRTSNVNPLELGTAIESSSDFDTVINLRGGESGEGLVIGNILLAGTADATDDIFASEGETVFMGGINSPGNYLGRLTVSGGGILRLGNDIEYSRPGDADPTIFDAQDSYLERLTVVGDGTLAFMLGDTDNDTPHVFATTAELGGTLKAHFAPGDYSNAATFSYANIIDTTTPFDNDQSDRFTAVISNTPLMTVEETYDDLNGTVSLVATRVAFGDVEGLTPNEQGVADYLDDIYGDPLPDAFQDLFGQIFSGLDGTEEYREALRELGGAEIAQGIQLQLNSFNELDQILVGKWIGEESPFEPFGYATSWGGPAGAAAYQASYAPDPAVSVWARGFATLSSSDGDINAPGYGALAYGGHAGADAMVSDTFMAGVAGGYLVEGVDFGEGDRLDYVGFQGAGYALFDNGGTWGRALGGYGYYQNTSQRHVTIGMIDETATASYVSQMAHVYAEAGHRVIDIGDMSISPYGSVSGTMGWVDGFTETGLSAGNLVVAPTVASSLVAGAGFQLEGETAMLNATLVTRGRVAYEYEFLEGAAINASFAGVPPSSGSFTTVGEEGVRGVVAAALGATMELPTQTSLSLDYKGRFAEGFMENSASVALQQKF